MQPDQVASPRNDSLEFDDDDDEILQQILRSSAAKSASAEITSPPTSVSGALTTGKDALFCSDVDELDNGLLGYTAPQSFSEIGQEPLNTPHLVAKDELSHYIYPQNMQVRDYQYNIVRRAFYDNLLVVLPTGLGKTFIASTVMLNFLRWFPKSRIIFMAPTRPLVAQQIKACCSITGIPATKVAILLDKTKKNREEIWTTKSVFFTTPQVVENDLAGGLVDPKSISLLVIDEAHRAKGLYAYNNVVKYLKRFNQAFRILALTATPASTVEGVQEVVTNLLISRVEARTERSIDLVKYMNRKHIDKRHLDATDDMKQLVDLLGAAIQPALDLANEKNIYHVRDPARINHFECMRLSEEIRNDPTLSEGLKWSYYFNLKLLGEVGQSLKRLHIYGIRSFYTYFKEKQNEFETKWTAKKLTNKLSATFYMSTPAKECLQVAKRFNDDPSYVSHPKIQVVVDELQEFFLTSNDSSRVIIFTELRESALELVRTLKLVGGASLKPHIFIGQSREKSRFDDKKYMASLTKLKKKKKALADEAAAAAVLTEPDTNRSSSEMAQETGMSQKMQKQVIREFKDGLHNVLIATSVGEEGLDIGEVDLIVCFDSTKSPIKNVQRMGRTGRKREGRVLLLFSSNEGDKFDHAIAGYEHLQSVIMDKLQIELAPRNRIIPDAYDPEPKLQFIEIPDENAAMNLVDDEDEIVKIATQYMMGSLAKASKAKKRAKAPSKKSGAGTKKTKKFNMPDNVETGFRSVTSMLKISQPPCKNKEEETCTAKTLLDTFLDSDTSDIELDRLDDLLQLPRHTVLQSAVSAQPLVDKVISPASQKHQQEVAFSSRQEADYRDTAVGNEHLIAHAEAAVQNDTSFNSPPIIQAPARNSPSPPNHMAPLSPKLHPDKLVKYEPKESSHAVGIAPKRKSLGVRRPRQAIASHNDTPSEPKHTPLDVMQQLKIPRAPNIKPLAVGETIQLEEDDFGISTYTVKQQSKARGDDATSVVSHLKECHHKSQSDNESAEILWADESRQESFLHENEFAPSKHIGESDCDVFNFDMDAATGVLSQDQMTELHMSYFLPFSSDDSHGFYDPVLGIHDDHDLKDRNGAFLGTIEHSLVSNRLIKFVLCARKNGIS